MILLQRERRAVTPTVTRRNRSRDERVAMVEPLLELQERQGYVRGHDVRAVARQHGISERQVRRAIAEALSEPPTPRAWKPPVELLVRTAMHRGNLMRAYQELAEENLHQGAHWDLRSYPTAHRAIYAEPVLRVALTKGMEATTRYLLVGEYEPDHRNELWYLDAKHIPVKCRDRFGHVIEDLWLLSVFDAYGRLVTGHACCVGEVTGQLTADVFLGAVLGRTITPEEFAEHGVERDLPAFIGGAPETLIVDNALANQSDLMKDAAQLVGTKLHYGRPHIPVDKAKQERWHWTLELDLQAVPGYQHAQRSHPADGHPSKPYSMPADADLPRVEAVIETINALIEQYNWQHVVSTTRQAPIPRYIADTGILRAISPVLLWPHMDAIGTYRVQPRGVKVDGTYRTASHPDFVVGTDVPVRWFPGVPGRMFFGVGDRFGGEVKPHAVVTEEERLARQALNAGRSRAARHILKTAGERLKAEGLPDEDADDAESASGATPTQRSNLPAPRRRNEPTPLNPDRKAAVELTWTDPTKKGAA